jgi:hypothetical protein
MTGQRRSEISLGTDHEDTFFPVAMDTFTTTFCVCLHPRKLEVVPFIASIEMSMDFIEKKYIIFADCYLNFFNYSFQIKISKSEFSKINI